MNGGTRIGGTGGGTIAPAREMQIVTEMYCVNEAKNCLHTVIGQLEERLSTVLTPVSPAQTAVQGPKDLVPLAAGLHDIRDGLDSAIERLRNIIARCEL